MSLPISELVPAHVRCFEAYTPSKPDPELMRLFGVDHLHRLNNNENALGPPPAAKRVIEGFEPPRSSVYPSGDSYFLRKALGERFGEPDRGSGDFGSATVVAVQRAFGEGLAGAGLQDAIHRRDLIAREAFGDHHGRLDLGDLARRSGFGGVGDVALRGKRVQCGELG